MLENMFLSISFSCESYRHHVTHVCELAGTVKVSALL